MQFKHAPAAVSAVFDDPNLVSAAGLVPVMRLAQAAGLGELAQQRLTVPTDKGANAGAKVSALVAGMVAGADSIDDMNLLRHGGMRRLFGSVYAPSTLGSFLRSFTFGQVRQLDAVASRFLTGLAALARIVPPVGGHGFTFVDLDGLVGAGDPEPAAAPRRGRLPARRRGESSATRWPRCADSAERETGCWCARTPRFTGTRNVGTAIKAGADVSVIVRMDPAVKRAIAAIDESTWTTIEYPDAVFDEPSGRWISHAEVAEVDFTAFASRRISERVTGRLVVRRIPDLNPNKAELSI